MFASRGPLIALLLAAGGPARAADVTDVASSFEEGNRFDFRLRARYDHYEKRAAIKREISGAPGQDSIQVFKDLIYSESRDSLALRAELGLYHDLMLHFELPVILSEQESYEFDQSVGPSCAFADQSHPTCVDLRNSSSVRDGIVPIGMANPNGQSQWTTPLGYDATSRGVFFPAGSTTVFKGPRRGARGGSGADAFDTFNIGLTWAPMSQAREDTKPTWIWAVEAQLSVGNIKRFDRGNPDGSHGVSEGVHRIFIKTALSKRIRFFEPYFGLWYMLPIARGDSLFVDYGAAEKTKNPQMQGGTLLGAELHAYDNPEKHYRLSFDLRARIEGHFAGRGYSEAWQLLAGAPQLACDATSLNPACDTTAKGSTPNKYQNQPYTGITTIENYATFGVDLAIAVQLGSYFRVRTGFQYSHDTSHLISGEDIGTPQNSSGRVINPNEFNPAYRPLIDLVGRRYRVDDVNVYDYYLWAQLMF